MPLYLDVHGLTTRLLPPGFEIRFDFVAHRLVVETAKDERAFDLVDGLTVAEFDRRLHEALGELDVAILEKPYGVPMTTPFPQDTEHATYDREAVERFWRALDWSADVLEEFAGWFAGKESPVHLFWHSFDLAVTRFSGRAAPPMPDADPVTREAYGEEVISFGFWAGDQNVPRAGVLRVRLPGAGGLRERALPTGARWVETGASSLAVLPYDDRAGRRRSADRAARLSRRLLPPRRRRRRVGPGGARVELVPVPRMNRHKRLTLVAAILGSAVATIDGTIVNVALPAIERDLGGGLASQQWVANAYLLALGPLILIGGSLGDIYGERRVFAIGVSAFGVLSLACALAPSIDFLIGARALQGAAGALVTPSSLAIIVNAFPTGERAAAIGAWTAWGGIAAIVGPLVGGEIVDHVSWRWIFAINIPLVAATLVLILAAVPPATRTEHRRVDVVGALLCVLGLGGFVFALVEQPRYGWASPAIWLPLVARDRPLRSVPGLRVAHPPSRW